MVLAGAFGEIALREPATLLWYQPSGCDDVRERLEAQERTRETWVSLYCDRSWLQEIGSTAVDGLLEHLSSRSDRRTPGFVIQPSLGCAAPVLRDILKLQSPQVDPLVWLQASTKAHELLYVTLRDARTLAGVPQERVRLTSRDRRLLQTAREILTREFVEPPPLGVLARRVGLNASKLCFGFRREFGETTSEFVRRLRLGHAKTLLEQTDLQIREVARRSGYQHHSTFTAAFVRDFGVSPKQVRLASAAGAIVNTAA
jgi:AraC-like DNA-binding protein